MTTRNAWITVVILTLALLVMLFVAGMVSEWLAPTVHVTEIGDAWSQAPCQEDMPCWDCETMGNRICGVEND